jgi:hypothetical protein
MNPTGQRAGFDHYQIRDVMLEHGLQVMPVGYHRPELRLVRVGLQQVGDRLELAQINRQDLCSYREGK